MQGYRELRGPSTIKENQDGENIKLGNYHNLIAVIHLCNKHTKWHKSYIY